MVFHLLAEESEFGSISETWKRAFDAGGLEGELKKQNRCPERLAPLQMKRQPKFGVPKQRLLQEWRFLGFHNLQGSKGFAFVV